MAVKHYVDEIPPSTGRLYRIESKTGIFDQSRSTIEDVTQYVQVGTPFGANDVNCTCVLECYYAKNGRVHELTTQNIESENIKFFATADFESGDTFTFCGNAVAAQTTDGRALGTNFFKANTMVECRRRGNTLYFAGSNKSITDDITGIAYHFGIENGKMYIEED